MRAGMRWLAVTGCLVAGLMLGSCGGGGGDTTSPNTQTLTGVAATGAAVSGIVTLKDIPTGQIQATHTDDGSYAFNITGLAGPFLLRVESDDHATTLYSVAFKNGSATRAQINPLTNLVLVRIGTNQPYISGTNPAELFDAPYLIVNLDTVNFAAALDWVLDHTSPYFRQQLAAHDVNVATLNPITDAFEIGTGLDLAFDDVKFFYDAATGESWEQSVATGEIVGTHKYVYGTEEPYMLDVTTPSLYLIPQASQTLSAVLSSDIFWELPVSQGLRWEVSDDSLATVDANGVVTAKAFSGTHSLVVTAHYQSGDLHLQDSVTLVLNELPVVDSVDMSRLPDSFTAIGNYPLYTTMHLGDDAGALSNYSGTWSLVDPDDYTQAAVHVVSINGLPYLNVGKPVQDLSVKLRAVQNINGFVVTTEKLVTVKKFVLTPVALGMQCPYYVDYQATVNCTAYVANNDGSQSAVTPELGLSVAAAESPYVTVSGNTLTSNWSNRSSSRYVTVTGSYLELRTSFGVTLNPRKTLLTGLEIVGLSELSEGGTTTLQGWATWDDGSRTTLGSYVQWSSSDNSVANFPSSSQGSLLARYILDQASDKAVTVTLQQCKYPGYNVSNCAPANVISTTAEITVRYAPPTLTALSVDTAALASGFLVEGGSYELKARATWNKKLPDGTAIVSTLGTGPTWSSSNPDAVVSGNMLTVGANPAEPLVMISATYQDPNDSGVSRTGRKVVTLYQPLNTPQYLSQSPGGYSDPATFVLGGDGLARQVDNYYDPGTGYSLRPGAPKPFISRVKQLAGFSYSNQVAYLRTDGTVWYHELVAGTAFSPEMRQQLIVQQGASYSYAIVPRPVPGLSNVVSIVTTGWSGSPAPMHVLKSDDTVWAFAAAQNYSTGVTTYSLSQQFSNASKMVSSGYVMFVLDKDGKVWSRGAPFSSLGRIGNTGAFGKVVKSDGTDLSGIVDIAATYDGNGFALDQQGTIWAWGNNNSNGQLGLGDNLARTVATPITSVTGFTRLSPHGNAALRSDGSLWAWGPVNLYASEPQRVGALAGLQQVIGAFLVGTGKEVSTWSVSGNGTTPVVLVNAVRSPQGSADSQLILQ